MYTASNVQSNINIHPILIQRSTLDKHRSNALELVNKVPPIEVEGDMAICDGGGGALGHPIEYIKVGYHGGKPGSCIYCGLKFVQKKGGHH
ncbi:hypothetical protein ACHAWO_013905 [Cyclotella atomus]|uniref:Zinc finger CHCC-type domain-containing protein n=1 Tax=Cyclotella atomus TaxID=382360 RepID=A0ABD3QQ63_9STRA